MNLVLFDPEDVADSGLATVRGSRARELYERLGVREGRQLKVGLLNGPIGSAETVRASESAIELRCGFDTAAAAPSPGGHGDSLILGLPRPVVLARVLEHATSLGFANIIVIRSWRSDKSHLSSRLLSDPDLQRQHLWNGLEQACRTHMPSLAIHDRFRPYVEDRLAQDTDGARRVVASPAAVACGPGEADRPFAVAVGPERGFTSFEEELLTTAGFEALGFGDGILKVETAVTAAHTGLALMRRLAARQYSP